MGAIVYGAEGANDGIISNSMCIRDKDRTNEQELEQANDAFGDALGLYRVILKVKRDAN